ncbi:hypothetical protein FRC06_010486, partial [Ceratobasidium sp. 370]
PFYTEHLLLSTPDALSWALTLLLIQLWVTGKAPASTAGKASVKSASPCLPVRAWLLPVPTPTLREETSSTPTVLALASYSKKSTAPCVRSRPQSAPSSLAHASSEGTKSVTKFSAGTGEADSHLVLVVFPLSSVMNL